MSDTSEPYGYVAVLFGDDTGCGMDHCPLGTVEWFATQGEAWEYLETVPKGFNPHVLSCRRRSADG